MKFFIVLMIALAWMGVATADHEGPKGHGGGACKDDVKKFCKDVKPDGKGAIMECMKSHAAELSAGCKAQHEKMMAMFGKMKELETACASDIKVLCPNEGDRKTMHCLHENGDKVKDAGCKTKLEAMKAAHAGHEKGHEEEHDQ